MKNNILISIGLPVYNESANIQKLLNSILSQIEDGYQLLEVIVVTDGCTDKTVDEISKIKSNKIKLIVGKKRVGKSGRISELLNMFSGDLIFLLDGDIEIRDQLLFSKIIKNSDIKKAGIVSVNARPKTSKSYFQKALYTGFEVVESIAKEWNKGKNYLHFKGCFLCLDRNLAKRISINKNIVNNDAYLYLKAVEQGYSPEHIENAIVYFKLPANFRDHVRQSKRFGNSKMELRRYFESSLEKEYSIPKRIYLLTIFKVLVKEHIHFVYYLLIKSLVSLNRGRFISSKWNIAISTK